MLITNIKGWREQLTRKLGVTVKDIYLPDETHPTAYNAVREHGILVFDRDTEAP